MRTPQILIVDDEPAIIKFVNANLLAEGYHTLMAVNGAEGLQLMEQEMPDLLILDIMLPRVDGFEVCRRVRSWSQVPIIMLSARGNNEDKVKCLDLGADDYVTKPFSIEELIARVGAVFRRQRMAQARPAVPSFKCDSLEILFSHRKVTLRGIEVALTPTEYHLLQELALNRGKVLTHTHLLSRVWGREYREEKEYLHTYIRRLRLKLEKEPAAPDYILTVPAVGYKFKDTP